ncbi:nucleoporin NDC1 [Venturia canescens]|uniref:nucleoporin NDC1 n=1 Tax=Venturia canescens TaxID=32260 RepID=UPI001C9BEAC2|nr:nucleoporin NDC1 [Venturia canescens]
MTEISHSGCKLLLGGRMFVAMVSSIVVQFIFMSFVILITNLSIMHPLSWLHDTWSIVTCFRMWCYFVVLATVIILQGVICSKTYLNAPVLLKSRFDAFCGMFTPHNFVVGGLHVAIGIVLVWLHLSLEGGAWSSLTETCRTVHGYCLIEEHYFLLLGGLWTGIYHFGRTNFWVLCYLEFSPIPQSKFVYVKRGVMDLLPRAMVMAIWPTLYFLGLYYFLGTYFRSIILSILFLSFEAEPLDTLSGLLNPSLIFHAWLYAALFILTIDTMHLLFQASLTQWMRFEIANQNAFNEESVHVTLAEVLAMDKIPIMQHLGYLDLVTLAQKDKTRRARLFDLSQPGGHPYNWNSVVEKCLDLLKKFAAEVDGVSSAKQEENHCAFKPTIEDQEKTYTYHMRNLIDVNSTSLKVDTETAKPHSSIVVEYLKSKRDLFVSYLLSKPLIFYFFGKQSDSKIRHVLTNGQTVVWAADAISSLAVISLKEDPYGIVQKDLPAIVENLFALKQALDKVQKTNILMRKPQNDDKTIRIILASLRMAVKRSIYRIVSSFGDYIEDIPLQKTIKHQLESFIVYRE